MYECMDVCMSVCMSVCLLACDADRNLPVMSVCLFFLSFPLYLPPSLPLSLSLSLFIFYFIFIFYFSVNYCSSEYFEGSSEPHLPVQETR